MNPDSSLSQRPELITSDHFQLCPHLPFVFPIEERSGRVPSAHESGYCIIFCHRLISSPTDSSSTSSFPIFTAPAVWRLHSIRYDPWWKIPSTHIIFTQEKKSSDDLKVNKTGKLRPTVYAMFFPLCRNKEFIFKMIKMTFSSVFIASSSNYANFSYNFK